MGSYVIGASGIAVGAWTYALEYSLQRLNGTPSTLSLSSIAAGASKSASHTTYAGTPNLSPWTAGEYKLDLDISAQGSNLTTSVSVVKLDSTLATAQATQALGTAQAGTGLKTFSFTSTGASAISTTGDVNSRLSLVITSTNSSMNATESMSYIAPNSLLTVPWSTNVAPGPPYTPTYSSTDTTVTISSATASDGATSYDREFDGVINNTVNSNAYVYSNLTPGTSYTYRYRAVNQYGTSAWSTTINPQTKLSYTTARAKFAVPPGILAGKQKFNVLVRKTTGANNPTAVATFWSSTTQQSAIGTAGTLQAPSTIVTSTTGQTLTFYLTESFISSVDEFIVQIEGRSSIDSQVEIGGIEWETNIVSTSYPAGTVAGLTADGTSTSTIQVGWTTHASATTYDLDIDGTLVTNVATNSYEITGLDPQEEVTVRVRAVNANGPSVWSAPVTGESEAGSITDAPVLSLDVTGDDVALDWTSVSGATTYELQRDNVTISDAMPLTYDDLDLADGSYDYRVRGTSSGDDGPWSNVETALIDTYVPPVGIQFRQWLGTGDGRLWLGTGTRPSVTGKQYIGRIQVLTWTARWGEKWGFDDVDDWGSTWKDIW